MLYTIYCNDVSISATADVTLLTAQAVANQEGLL